MARCGALNSLMDDRFSGGKHFWSAICVDRPRKEKFLLENIEKYYDEGDFSDEEKIGYLVELTGVFPFNRVMKPEIYRILEVIDDTNTLTKIRCWGVQEYDRIHVNRPYMASLDHNDKWGFSTRSIRRNFRKLA